MKSRHCMNGFSHTYLTKLLHYWRCQGKINHLVGTRKEKTYISMNCLSLQVRTSETVAWLKSKELKKVDLQSVFESPERAVWAWPDVWKLQSSWIQYSYPNSAAWWVGERASSCMKTYLQLVRSIGTMMGTCPEYNCSWILVILQFTEILQRKQDREFVSLFLFLA